MAIAFLCLAVLFGIAAVHPFVTYPLSLLIAKRLFGRRWIVQKPADQDGRIDACAVCFCAYNEAKSIQRKIENIQEIRRRLAEQGLLINIYVYTDGCSDNTALILKTYEDEIHLVVSPNRTGKSAGMNTLLNQVRDPYIVFTDADILFDEKTIPELLMPFHDPKVGCVVGYHKVTNDAESATATTGSFYWRFEHFLKQLESDTGSVMGAAGSIFAIRRELYRQVPADIVDDTFTSMSILFDGYRIVQAKNAIAFGRTAVSPHEEYRRKIRIACQNFNCHRLLLPRLLQLKPWNLYKYTSHKLLRWFVIFWIMGAAIFFFLAALMFDLVFAICLLIALLGISTLTVLLSKWTLVRCGTQTLMAFTAVGIGVLKSLRGERFQTWEPPASARKS